METGNAHLCDLGNVILKITLPLWLPVSRGVKSSTSIEGKIICRT
jgi:hypothetical protein